MAWRFHRETFRLRSHLGSIPGANLEDWPVGYDELEPYYEKAEYELGVSGDSNPFGPPRRRPLPLPPVADNREAEVLFPAARRLGWSPFHTPLAILSQPYRGRPACTRCAFCNAFIPITEDDPVLLIGKPWQQLDAATSLRHTNGA